MKENTVTKPVSETRVRVRYAETDQMGVVYHSNYLIWFEVGRVEFIRQLGLNYKQMEEEDGCGISVVDVHARYRAPARYDDELVIETRLLAARGAIIKFGYGIVRVADGVLLCEGETTHVCVGRNMKKMCLPAKYAERFAAHLI
jgi:acyl-CoA thioester hydrolase